MSLGLLLRLLNTVTMVSGASRKTRKTYPYLLREVARPTTPAKSRAPRTSL
jgi:hypothetical protein